MVSRMYNYCFKIGTTESSAKHICIMSAYAVYGLQGVLWVFCVGCPSPGILYGPPAWYTFKSKLTAITHATFCLYPDFSSQNCW